MKKIEIGRVGFDVIRLIGFDYPSKGFIEPVIEHCAKKDGKYRTDLANREGIRATRKKVSIKGSYYLVQFGNHGDSPFFSITVYAKFLSFLKKEGKPGEVPINNIENMRVCDIWEALNCIDDDLYTRYDIRLSYKQENIRIARAEINKTFFMDFPFEAYRRSLDQISHIFRTSKKTGAGIFLGKNQTDLETYYILQGSTISIKVYDKGRQLQKELGDFAQNQHIIPHGSLIRVEITSNEQNLRKLVELNNTEERESETSRMDVLLYKVTDASLEAYFESYFERAFQLIDQETAGFFYVDIDVIKKLHVDNKSDISMVQKIPPVYYYILNAALELIELTHQDKMLAKNLLDNLYIAESSTGISKLPDLDSLIEFLQLDTTIIHKHGLIDALRERYYGSGWNSEDPEKMYLQAGMHYREFKEKILFPVSDNLKWEVLNNQGQKIYQISKVPKQ